MSESVYPTEVSRIKSETANSTIGAGLAISWSDGSRVELSSKALRDNCPCASCLEKQGDSSHAQPLRPGKSLLKVINSTLDEELDLQEVWLVGNYALGMRWGDRHDSGIYTFSSLYQLSQKAS